MVRVQPRITESVRKLPGPLPRAETFVISIVESEPCDCETSTSTTAQQTSTSACPSFASTSAGTSSTSSATSNPCNNVAFPSSLPAFPSSQSDIRTLTQKITDHSTTFTTTLTFTPRPSSNNPNDNNGNNNNNNNDNNPNPHPTSPETPSPPLPTPTVIAIIVVCCVAGTALVYIIYRVNAAQRMNPPPSSWRRNWEINPPPRGPGPHNGGSDGRGGRDGGSNGYDRGGEITEISPTPEMSQPQRDPITSKKTKKKKRASIIIEEGSLSSTAGGYRDPERGQSRSRTRRVVGLRVEQDRWVRIDRRDNRRSSSSRHQGDPGGTGLGIEGGTNGREGDDEVIYMRRRGEGNNGGEMEEVPQGQDQDDDDVLVVRRVRVRNEVRREEGSGVSGGGERRIEGNVERGVGRGRVRRGAGGAGGGQSRRGGGQRFEMTGGA